MSFISKKHIPRRTFLQASGVTLALPMLEAMLPAGTALAQTAAGQVKPRFVGVFFPHGMAPGYWAPEAEGALPETGHMVLRLTSDIVSEAEIDGVPRREKLPRGPGGTYCGLIIVFSIHTLTPLAILHDGYIQVNRVACTSALATRLLARETATSLGLLGSGGQAWAHLCAMATVRRLDRVRIFSPTREHREALARRARDELRLKVHRWDGIPLIVTYHPAALLRNPNWKKPAWDDVRIARQLLGD